MFFLAKLIRDKASKFKKEHTEGEDEKPFLEHLEDLRKTLFKILITLGVVTICTFVFNKQLLAIVQFPLEMANIPPWARKLDIFGAVEPMMLAIKVSFVAGIILSFPLLMFFIGEFILPGLKDNEKKLVLPSLLVGAALFLIGICFAYFAVIPMALEFFFNFAQDREWEFKLRAGYYYSFAVQMILVFGISFELPVVVMALVKLEILSHRVMRNTRSTAIVVMVIVSAVITPTTDVFTLSLLAGPLIILYEICIWLAWWLEKKRERQEERERQASLPTAEPLPEPDLDPDNDPDPKPIAAAGITEAASPDHFDSDHLESTTPTYDADNEYVEGEDEANEPDITPGGESSEDHNTGHDDYSHSNDSGDSGDDYWNDPYHHDEYHDGHHNDQSDHYSGPTEELKRELREELTQQIKAELRIELLQQLRQELNANSAKAKRISIDPRRGRRSK